jgi:hypothetical protein
MNQDTVEILGTLRPDGTLVLDEQPKLHPGRVKVRLQPAPVTSQPAETLVDFVQRVRREAAAAGSHFMGDQEVTAWIEELRADDDRIEGAYQEQAGERSTRE